MSSTIIVNFYGGPGTGKSTMAARVFANLKEQGVNVELVTEYAKDMTWEESYNVLSNQIYVFGQQQHRIWRLIGKVDFIITDAPLLNSIVYSKYESTLFKQLVEQEYHKHLNYDIFLDRVKVYNPKGRSQTLNEAIAIDDRTKEVLSEVRRCRIGESTILPGWCDLQIAGKAESTDDIIRELNTFKEILDTYSNTSNLYKK